MLSRKKQAKEGYLTQLYSKRNVKSICVIGTDKGIGCTSFLNLLATYLTQVKRYNIAIIDVSDKDMFSSLLSFGDKISENVIRYNKVDYYRGNAQGNIYGMLYEERCFEKYDYVLYECKSFIKKDIESIIRADFKIVIGSYALWKKQNCINQIENLSNISGSDRWMYVIQGDDFSIKEIKNKTKNMVVKMPYIENSFKLNHIMLEFLEKII